MDTFRNSLNNRAVRYAARKGYRVVGKDRLWSPTSRKYLVLSEHRGYLSIQLTNREIGGCGRLFLHRLQAFLIFGEAIFRPGVQVRHLDGDPRNNVPGNIAIGTPSQNLLDRDPGERLRHARRAALKRRKLTYKEAEELRR